MKRKTLEIIAAVFCLISSSAHAASLKVPLDTFAPVPSVDLQCMLGEAEISIPIPERWEITKAQLVLHYVSSNTLLSNKSQLIVHLNDRTIGQVVLDPLEPENSLKLEIPAALLKVGYNSLSFQAAQHYAAKCEQYCSPNLWTTLNYAESFLKLDYELAPVPLKLSAISGFLFDPKIFIGGEAHMITEKLDSDNLTWAGIAASGIAGKFGYRTVEFDVSNDIALGRDNVLIGSKKFVETFLKRRQINIAVTGPFMQIMHLPSGNVSSSRAALLVLSGTNPREIRMAAETFAHMTLPYPGTEKMVIQDLKAPVHSPYTGRNILTTDKEYSFREMDLSTHTFTGFNPHVLKIGFQLPSDFLIKENQYSEINLNFAYGAGMRQDSVLNITVNDKSVRAVHLKDPAGENIEKYRIELPTYLFKPGYNNITFSPVMNPVHQECDIFRPEGFFLTIFENSTFYFPAMPHFVQMPNMELFMQNGFPFTRKPDGSETVIYLTRADYDTAAAALNIIGLMTHKNGYPMLKTSITFEKPASEDRDLIIIGDLTTLPKEMLSEAPLNLSPTNVVPYPAYKNGKQDLLFAISSQIGSIGRGLGVLMEFQSPATIGRSVLMMTGASSVEVSALSRELLKPDVQARVTGDLALIESKGPVVIVTAVRAGKRYYTGLSGLSFLYEFYLYKYPYLNYLLLAVLMLMAGMIVFVALSRLRKKRMQ